MKKEIAVRMGVSIPLRFADQEDLDQQIEDLKLELESLGFEVEAVKCKHPDDEESDEDLEGEAYDEDL